MSVVIRPAEPEELPRVSGQLARAFLGDHRPDEDEGFEACTDWSRTRCAFEDGELLGTLGAYGFELAVPGATLPAAGTTYVSVRSDSRRRGLLNQMMRGHLEDTRERGESLAVLWASEAGIYGRFGFGWGTDAVEVTLDTRHAEFAGSLPATGRVRMLEAEDAAKELPPIYEQLWRERPGHFARDEAWWEHRRLTDHPAWREGASAFRFAVYREEGRPRGYVQYRVKERWVDSMPRGSLTVVELQGLDPAARAALWRHVIDVDLVTRVSAWNLAADSELPWLLADSRAAVREPRDSLWVCLVDVTAALAGRRYANEGRLLLGVRNGFWSDAEGVFELEAGPEGASCRRRDAADAEVELDASDLGALYLGGRSFRALARAGRVRGEARALARADALFTWDPVPWCPEMF